MSFATLHTKLTIPPSRVNLVARPRLMSNRGIADALTLTVGTVKTHVHSILGKLDAASRTQAIARARERGLLGG